MESRFGLVQELLSLGVLSRADFYAINSTTVVVEKNHKLLMFLLEKTDVEKLADFRIALDRTGQRHVVNYLDWDGGEFFTLIFLSDLSGFCFRWLMNCLLQGN